MYVCICVRVYMHCNTPSPWGQERDVFLNSYLISWMKQTEFPLKTNHSLAKSLTIIPRG